MGGGIGREARQNWLTNLESLTRIGGIPPTPTALADGVGFEPTDAFTSLVFKTSALNRSATHPLFDTSPVAAP